MAAIDRYRRMIAIASFFVLSTHACFSPAAQSVDQTARSAEHVLSSATTPEQLVALDLVGTLMQVEQISPNLTAFSMQPAEDPFGANLRQTLEMAGYTMVSVGDRQPSKLVDYSISERVTDTGVIRTYQINAESIKVRRDYLIAGKTTKPVSTVYVQGADASRIYLNDEIFNGAAAIAAVEPNVDSLDEAGPEVIPEIFLNTIDQAESYKVGMPIIITASSNSESRLYCYYQDGHGQIARIYPNRFNTENHIESNQAVMIPATDAWNINATRVGASDDFLCVATDPSNHSVIAVLDEDPDLEPLAARSLDQIQQGLAASSEMPIIFQKLSLPVE